MDSFLKIIGQYVREATEGMLIYIFLKGKAWKGVLVEKEMCVASSKNRVFYNTVALGFFPSAQQTPPGYTPLSCSSR